MRRWGGGFGGGVGGGRCSQPDRKWRRTATKESFLPPQALLLFVIRRKEVWRKREEDEWLGCKREMRREGGKNEILNTIVRL